MKKLAIAVLFVMTACHRQSDGGPPSGSSSAREAIERFLATAKARDFDGMSLVWGSAKGPARATIPRQDLEQREFVMMGCLKHDQSQILRETPTGSGERVFVVQLTLRDLTASTQFTVVPGPGGRWYVREFRVEELQSICTSL